MQGDWVRRQGFSGQRPSSFPLPSRKGSSAKLRFCRFKAESDGEQDGIGSETLFSFAEESEREGRRARLAQTNFRA
jgi:hypothetical protein